MSQNDFSTYLSRNHRNRCAWRFHELLSGSRRQPLRWSLRTAKSFQSLRWFLDEMWRNCRTFWLPGMKFKSLLTTGNFGVRILLEMCIQDGVTDLIAHLVWKFGWEKQILVSISYISMTLRCVDLWLSKNSIYISRQLRPAWALWIPFVVGNNATLKEYYQFKSGKFI